MSAPKPGDVVMVDLGDGDWNPAVSSISLDGLPEWVAIGADIHWMADGSEPVRPLVVIDPENAEQVERLLFMISDLVSPSQMREALAHFADPKPRIEEPRGLGAVVADADGHRWTRANSQGEWFCECGDEVFATWDEFTTAAEVLSEGVTA